MASAIFDKLTLRSEEDLLHISKLLDESLKQYIQANGDKLAPERISALGASIGGTFKEMEQFVAVGGGDDGPEGGLNTPSAAGLKSPMLPPLSPLQKDDEVLALESQVESASKRVAQLRASMQTQVQEKLSAKLAASRPSAELAPLPTAPSAEEGDAADRSMSPAAEELRSRLVEAAGKMPELLARLEEAHSRLDTVLDAAAAAGDASRVRAPPNTIEKAVLGVSAREDEESDDDDDDGGGNDDGEREVNTNEGPATDPMLKQALQTGLVSTRRSGDDLVPVPFPGAASGEDFEGGGGGGEEQQ